MNLYSGTAPANPTGHQTVVNNNIGPAKASSGQKTGWIILQVLAWLTIIGGIILLVLSIKKNNSFQRQQLEINNSASNIDVQLQKRSETLIKLVDSVKGHVNFEKETLTKITALRGGVNNGSVTENNQQVADIARSINISVEQYPNLQASESIQKLMQESAYIEKEIAAQRRLYNQNVTSFNQEIWVFPWIVIANNKNLSTIELFAASEESKKDVKIDF